MPRRKQDCPKRRDFCPDEVIAEEARKKPNSSRGAEDFVSKMAFLKAADEDAVPLDLSTKKRKTPSPPKRRSFTDYSVANNLSSPPKKPRPSATEQKPDGTTFPKFSAGLLSAGAVSSFLAYPAPATFPFSSVFSVPSLCGTTPTGILPFLNLPTLPVPDVTSQSKASKSSATPRKPPNPATSSPPVSRSKSDSLSSLNALSSLVQTVGTKQNPGGLTGSSISKIGCGSSLNLSPSSASGGSVSGSKDDTDSSGQGNSATNGTMTMQELWWKYMKKEESAEIKRTNEAKQIFTCLQCHQSFQSMDQLVKHMEVTQHFTNVPKHYSWSLQYARQKMRQMKLKLKYSERMMYFCHMCSAPFTVPVHQHFAEMHDMHNPVDNMNFVQIVMVNSNGTTRRLKSPSGQSAGSGIDLRTPTPASLSGSSPSMSPSLSPKLNQKASDFKSAEMLKDLSPSKKLKGKSAGESNNNNLKTETDTTNEESAENLLKKMEELVQNAVDRGPNKGATKMEEGTPLLPTVHSSLVSNGVASKEKS